MGRIDIYFIREQNENMRWMPKQGYIKRNQCIELLACIVDTLCILIHKKLSKGPNDCFSVLFALLQGTKTGC